MKHPIVVTSEAPLNLLRQSIAAIGRPPLLTYGRDSQALDRKKTEIKNLDLANVAEINQVIDK